MIEQAADYQLVTPVGIIDGGILPARDVAADGSAHALRAEDLCFALEAVKERDFAQRTALMGMPVPKHVVKRADWNKVWEGLRAACFGGYGTVGVRAIDASEQFPATQYINSSQISSTDIGGFYPNAVLSSCHTADVTSPDEDNGFWRKFYYDLKRSDRLYVPADTYNNLGSWSASGTYMRWDGETCPVAARADGGIYAPRFMGKVRELEYRYTGSGDAAQRVATGVSYSTLTRLSLPLVGSVASAVAVAVYSLEVRGVGKLQEVYYFARCFPCNITSGGVVVSPAVILPSPGFDLVSVCESLGHPFPAETTDPAGVHAYVEHEATYIVAKYEFRTNNLNAQNSRAYGWQWTP